MAHEVPTCKETKLLSSPAGGAKRSGQATRRGEGRLVRRDFGADDPKDRRSPGTLYLYGPQGYLGAYRANENGFQATTRGIPLGHYMLQPKPKSGANWPAGTPAITGPGQPPGKPGPGYQANAILLHPAGGAGYAGFAGVYHGE